MVSSAPNSQQILIKFLSAATTSSVLLVLSGLSYTATVVFLVVATPVLLLFSPVLVPAGIVINLVALGFVFSGGFGMGALPALSWIWTQVSGKQLIRPDQLDNARMNKAGESKDERIEEEEQDEQKEAEEATQSS